VRFVNAYHCLFLFCVALAVCAGIGCEGKPESLPEPLDIEKARAALIARITADPKQFAEYGEEESINTLRRTPAEVQKDGTWYLRIDGWSGGILFTGFSIDLQARTYAASVQKPHKWILLQLNGTFSLDPMGNWEASKPERAHGDPPMFWGTWKEKEEMERKRNR
jgi:hypothetical protein